MNPVAVLDDDTWVTADHHFGHQNILRLCDRPADSFYTMERLWHAKVRPNDVVLHLGDVMYRGVGADMRTLLRELPGQKLLIRGNHDKQNARWYASAGFVLIEPFLWWDPERQRSVYFSHRPDTLLLHWDINVHGHIHNNGYPPDTPIRDYRNVSVEVTGYAPVRLSEVLHAEPGGFSATLKDAIR